MQGEKKFLYTSSTNRVNLTRFQEVKMSVILEWMQNDDELWAYMVDPGDRKAPRWNRDYALNVLATIKPDFVRQVWNHCEKSRLTRNVDEELAR